MSGTGRVIIVDRGTVPNTNAPAQRVLVDRADGARLCFFIPPGAAPATGDAIQWGPHHASWAGHRTRKLTHEIDPDAPLR